MLKQMKIRPIFKGIVGVTVVLVVIFVIATQIHKVSTYTFTPMAELIGDFNSIPVFARSTALNDMKVVDRKTFYYVERHFSSTESVSVITKYYVDYFKSDGWNYLGTIKYGDNSSRFCKKGVLGTLGFMTGNGPGTAYVITLTTGGDAIATCG